MGLPKRSRWRKHSEESWQQRSGNIYARTQPEPLVMEKSSRETAGVGEEADEPRGSAFNVKIYARGSEVREKDRDRARKRRCP